MTDTHTESQASTLPRKLAIYEARVKTKKTCPQCEHVFSIEPIKPVSGTVETISTKIRAVLLDELYELGWRGDLCPLCAYATGRDQDRKEGA